MKKEIFITISTILILLFLIIGFYSITQNKTTGKIISGENQIGPSAEEQSCMMQCMKCTSPGVDCVGSYDQCSQQCNIQKPEITEETSCMEKCVVIGCGKFDFSCQEKNKNKCEEECNMLGDKPNESEMSAEQLCITKCVAEIDSSIRCGASQEGETGGEVCQRCSQQCVSLYEGPCLDDEKLKTKQKECETCEHCYGEPTLGESGEGWECIVDVECKDATSEFGDESGTGEEGIITKTGEVIGNIIESIGNFFKNIFNNDKIE